MIVSNKQYDVYIVTNAVRTVLYIGVTNDLQQRIVEHYLSRGNRSTFTGSYNCYFLVHDESFRYINEAIAREKEIKKCQEKIRII